MSLLDECASDLAQTEGLLLNRVGGKWAFWLTLNSRPVVSFLGDTVAEVVGAMRTELERRRELQISILQGGAQRAKSLCVCSVPARRTVDGVCPMCGALQP